MEPEQSTVQSGTVECAGCGIPTHVNNAFWKVRSIVRDARLPVGIRPPSKPKNIGKLGKIYLKEHFCDRCSMLITGYIENLGNGTV
jgi:hypothetical protein